MKHLPIVLSSLLIFSCGEKDEDDPIALEEPEIAACQVLTIGGVSPLNDSTGEESESTPVIACYESKSQLTVEWCEKASGQFDPDLRAYSLFKGQDFCPIENRVGKCVYTNTRDGEDVTIWYYSREDVPTDFDEVRKGCNYDGMYFSVE